MIGGEIMNPSWDMFSVIQVLGEGAYGKVYKVKCLRNTAIPNSTEKILPQSHKMRVKRTYTTLKGKNANVRELLID